MSGSSRKLDRFATTFDHEGLVANAGLILAGTLMARLGLLGLIERWVRTGSANPGPKIAHGGRGDGGGRHSHRSCRDAARRAHRCRCWGSNRWRPRRWGRSCGPSRSVTSASSKRCCRAPWRGRGGWERAPAQRRWWSMWTPRSARSTASTRAAPRTATPRCWAITRCWPHAPTPARCSPRACAKAPRGRREEWCDSSTSSSPACKRAGAAGPLTVRADSGFWSRKLIDRLDAHDVKWSITVALGSAVRAAIQAIPESAWADIAYTKGGRAQVAETAIRHRPRQSQAHRSPRGAPHPTRPGRPTTDVARLATPRVHHQHRPRHRRR